MKEEKILKAITEVTKKYADKDIGIVKFVRVSLIRNEMLKPEMGCNSSLCWF